MNEGKLARSSLNDLVPNNSDKAARIKPNDAKKATAEKKKLAPIVKGKVVKQKQSAFGKFKESFLGESGDIREYVVYDILVPAFRNTVSDMGFGVIEMLFGTGRERGRYRGDSRVVRDRGRSYVSYNNASSDRGRGGRRDMDNGDRARHNFENVIFDSRGEAEDVLSHLVDLTIEYQEATVAAFYELSNIESTHTDNNYGWTNLRDAYTERVRNGYIIKFPQPRPLG